eukprot:g14200.t1
MEQKATPYAGFETADSIYVPDDGSITPILWIFWGQGLGSAPCIVRRAYLSWLHAARLHAEATPQPQDPNRAHWRVIFLDAESVKNYVAKKDLDSIALYADPKVARFCDLVRLALLERFGGVYLDATLLPTYRSGEGMKSQSPLAFITDRFRGSGDIVVSGDSGVGGAGVGGEDQGIAPPTTGDLRPEADERVDVDMTGSGGILTAARGSGGGDRFSPKSEMLGLRIDDGTEDPTGGKIPLFESYFIAAAPKSQFLCLWKMEFQELLILGTDAQIRKTTSAFGPLEGKGKLRPSGEGDARYLSIHLSHQFPLQSYALGFNSYHDPSDTSTNAKNAAEDETRSPVPHFRLAFEWAHETASWMHINHSLYDEGVTKAQVTDVFAAQGQDFPNSPKYLLKLFDAAGIPADFWKKLKEGSYAQRTLWPLGLPKSEETLREECSVSAANRTAEATKEIAEERKKLVGEPAYQKLEEF